MSTRWNYKVVEVKPHWTGKAGQVEATLVQLGMQGWELVSVGHQGLKIMLYLKKAI